MPSCVYCGYPLYRIKTRKHPPTCREHRDLPALDPNYEGIIYIRTPARKVP